METAVRVKHETGSNGDSGAASIPERLQRRNQVRLEEAERRREALLEQNAVQEDFLSVFSRERLAVEELLTGRELEEAAAKLLKLQSFLTDSLASLSQYELAHAQHALTKLHANLNQARQEGVPKKKFAFRVRTKGSGPAPSPDVQVDTGHAPSPDVQVDTGHAPSPDVQVDTGHAPSPDVQVDTGHAPSLDPKPLPATQGVTEQCGFFQVEDQTLTLSGVQIQSRDVTLIQLRRCKVRLQGAPSTLHLQQIEDCEILCGPVSTSVFVCDCQRSLLAAPCQQLRMHRSSDTQVYLHVTSRPIIEDCHDVTFAPFSWSYPNLEQDFNAAGLDRDSNNWDQVQDFNWLSAGSPSPNWNLVPEEDRRTSWDL